MPTQTIDFNDVTSVTFNNNPVSEIVLNDEIIWPIQSAPDLWISIESSGPFELYVVDNSKKWNGNIYFADPGSSPNISLYNNDYGWGIWNPAGGGGGRVLEVSSPDIFFYADGKYRILLRGVGNQYITGSTASSSAGAWRIHSLDNKYDMKIKGNIAYLLDWQYYYQYGTLPTPSDYAFTSWWAFPSNNMPSSSYCLHDASELILPFDNVPGSCYRSMFFCHKWLELPPSLKNITTLGTGGRNCYGMFYNTNITKLPKLESRNLPSFCYQNMFYGCANIVISTTKTGSYQNAWKVPFSNTSISTGSNPTGDMFKNTSGSFTGSPTVDTTYYTSNEII